MPFTSTWLRKLVSRSGAPSADPALAEESVSGSGEKPAEAPAVQAAPAVTRLDQVFGKPSHTVPLSYIVRDVEREFRQALSDDRYEVLVIYGNSKQGKSSLRRHALPTESCTFVSATQNVTREAVYREALNLVGARIGTKREIKSSVERKFSAKLNAPSWTMLESLFGIGASTERERSDGVTTEDVDVDLSFAAAVARIYARHAGRKPIVIDNFHYFEPDMQAQLATDVRAFAEHGIKVVILGTWKAQNFIQKKNVDLIGRVCALSIEPWADADLMRVLDAGERHLNVRFAKKIRAELLQRCTGNIALLQEIVHLYLKLLGITERSEAPVRIVDDYHLRKACRAVAEGALLHTTELFQQIARIGDAWIGDKTRMHWILRAFLSDPQATHVDGVEIARLFNRAKAALAGLGHSADDLTQGIVSSLLKTQLLPAQQKAMQTPIIGYDPTSDRLATMDSWALFTIRLYRDRIVAALE